ncbi:MAG: hypothetical protein ABII74_04545 [Elusimicrobiota bacterium]
MRQIKAFGEYFKNRRVVLKKTLRQFCLDNKYDPGNISRLERGIMSPPREQSKLEEYAKALKIKQGSTEWYEFFDMARASKGIIPPELMKEDIVRRLPLVFRTLGGKKLSRERLEKIIKLIDKH